MAIKNVTMQQSLKLILEKNFIILYLYNNNIKY